MLIRRKHVFGVTFVSSTRDSPSAHRFFGNSFLTALERHGLPTTTIQPTTRMATLFPGRTVGYASTRSLPTSPRFLLDVARAHGRFVIASEYGLESFLTLLVARLTHRKALVFQEHAGRAGERISPLDIRYRRIVGRLASGFIANTVAAAEEIVELLDVDPARVFQVTTLVAPYREELCQGPPTIELPRSRPLFLYIGQLIPRKNLTTLLEAAAILRRDGLAFEVWIGGEGPDRQQLSETAQHLELDGIVRFIGQTPYASVGHIYEACDVFVMPSNADYRSVAVLEAMRFGKAVIDSAHDGNAGDGAHEGVNAFIFDPADASALAGCMRRFVIRPSLALEMGERSEIHMSRHTPDTAAQGLIEALTRLDV